MKIAECNVVWPSRRLLKFRRKCSPTFRRSRKSFSYIGNAYPMKTTRCCSFCVWDTPPPLEFVDSVANEGSLSRPPEPGMSLRLACCARNTTPLRGLSKWLSAAACLEAHRTPADMSGWKPWCLLYMNISSMFAYAIGRRGPRGKRWNNVVSSMADIFVVVHLEQGAIRDMNNSYRTHQEQNRKMRIGIYNLSKS